MGREQLTEVETPKARRQGNELSKKLVADLMVAALHQGNLDCLQLFGLGAPQVTLLRSLRLRDQSRLHKLYRDCLTNFRIEVDEARLQSTITHLVAADDDENLIDRMLELGAGQSVMLALCGLQERDTVIRRREIGAEVSYGRARLPEFEVRVGISMQWTQLAPTEPDPRKRIIRLAESSGFSIATIWSILREANLPPPNNSSTVGNANAVTEPSRRHEQRL